MFADAVSNWHRIRDHHIEGLLLLARQPSALCPREDAFHLNALFGIGRARYVHEAATVPESALGEGGGWLELLRSEDGVEVVSKLSLSAS